MIDRILREILDEQATDEDDDSDTRPSLKAHLETRLGGQRIVVIPPETDVVTARQQGTVIEAEEMLDLGECQ